MYKNIFFLFIVLGCFFSLTSFIYSLVLVPTSTVFYFDQARDAYEAYAIWHNHDIKILGPSSDIPGINHGVLWYYFLALLYSATNGSPEGALYILICGLYAFLPFIAYFTYKMSKNSIITSVTVGLYAISPLYFSFTHWLSNPVLSLFIGPVLFYFLWKRITQHNLWINLLLGFLFGLLVQSDFAFVVLLLTLPLYLFVFKLRVKITDIVLFIGGLIVGLSPILITYIKFHTNIIGIILGFLSGSGSSFSFFGMISGFIEAILKLFTLTYLPLPVYLIAFLLVLVVFFYKKLLTPKDTFIKLTLIWLVGIVLMFVLNRGNLSAVFLYGPFLYPLALLVSFSLLKLIKNTKIIFIIFLALGILQFMTIHKWVSDGYSPLSIQKGMTTNYQEQLIDYVYTSANKEPFVINTITNPLYINTTWSYLFENYGKPKYQYLPLLWGRDQTGYLGNMSLQTDLKTPTLRYLIIEPSAGIQLYWIAKITYDEDLLSDVVEEKKFGELTVQKRLFHPNKTPVPMPAILLK